MPKYNPGDFVTVRSDLKEGINYYMEDITGDYNQAVGDMLCLRVKLYRFHTWMQDNMRCLVMIGDGLMRCSKVSYLLNSHPNFE